MTEEKIRQGSFLKKKHSSDILENSNDIPTEVPLEDIQSERVLMEEINLGGITQECPPKETPPNVPEEMPPLGEIQMEESQIEEVLMSEELPKLAVIESPTTVDYSVPSHVITIEEPLSEAGSIVDGDDKGDKFDDTKVKRKSGLRRIIRDLF